MDIFSLVILTIFGLASSINGSEDSASSATQSRYTCGIRKNYVVDLIHKAHSAVRGQWPWHAALFQGKVYRCGGTLIDQRHVLTSAHCVVVQRNKRPLAAGEVTIQLGKLHLDDDKDFVQIMAVSEIRIHEKFETHTNDIALLVLSSSVRYSDFVIPICIESIQTAKADDLEGRRGWTVGWGETEEGKLSKVLKTAQMPVVNNTVCVQSDSQLFGRFISDKVFCAGDQNGTSVCRGDSGGGMYVLAGDQWELRGIVSFAGYKSETASCDTMRYVVFTNVASYYHWIKWQTGAVVDTNASTPKRISERKCRQYRKIAKKTESGVCTNSRSPHTVAIIDRNQRHISSGIILSEKFILTKAPNLLDIFEMDVDWDELRVRVGNQADAKILREITHPGYDYTTYRNHVMLLELETPLIFTDVLLPACLANEASENLYDTLLVNGYTGLNQTANNFHENVANRYMLNELCNTSIQAVDKKYTLNREEICTRFSSSATFDWKGIIGGPLQTVNTRSCMFTLVGVTKYLIPYNESQNGLKSYINVYSRVTAYLDWIEQVVWENEPVVDESLDGADETADSDIADNLMQSEPELRVDVQETAPAQAFEGSEVIEINQESEQKSRARTQIGSQFLIVGTFLVVIVFNKKFKFYYGVTCNKNKDHVVLN